MIYKVVLTAKRSQSKEYYIYIVLFLEQNKEYNFNRQLPTSISKLLYVPSYYQFIIDRIEEVGGILTKF